MLRAGERRRGRASVDWPHPRLGARSPLRFALLGLTSRLTAAGAGHGKPGGRACARPRTTPFQSAPGNLFNPFSIDVGEYDNGPRHDLIRWSHSPFTGIRAGKAALLGCPEITRFPIGRVSDAARRHLTTLDFPANGAGL